MKLYSDFPLRRFGQLMADLVALTVIVLGVWLASVVSSTVSRLADLGRQLELGGKGFKVAMIDAGESLGAVPLVGDSIRVPFDRASDTGEILESAGQSAQTFILTAATVAGALVCLLIVATVCWVWLRRRIRFSRRAFEANRLSRMEGGTDVLALRALVTASSKSLVSVGPHPVMGWRAGDAHVLARLAAIELRGAGVRLAR